MTYRIETSRDPSETRIGFEGVLDNRALDTIVELAAAAMREGARSVCLVLGVGSDVDGHCIDRLKALEAFTVETTSPFLAHWFRRAGIRTNSPKESS
jgi:hypothetical protein